MYMPICRSCLQTDVTSTHLFSHVVNGKTLSEMLMDCATIKVIIELNHLILNVNYDHLCRELARQSDLKLRQSNPAIQNDLTNVKDEPYLKYENTESTKFIAQNEIVQPQLPNELPKTSATSNLTKENFNFANTSSIYQKETEDQQSDFNEISSKSDNLTGTNVMQIEQKLSNNLDDKYDFNNVVQQPESYEASNEYSNDSIGDLDDNISKTDEDAPSIPKSLSVEETKPQRTKKTKHPNVHCKGCNKVYSYNYYHQIHIHTHMGNALMCNICGKFCSNIYQLRKHRAEHQDRHVCYICGENFKTFNKLQYHRQTIHKNDKTAKADQTCVCDICGKSFKSTWSMYYHKITHKNGKPQTCKICNKGFVNENALEKHIAVLHNKEKFICDECGKMFPALHNLQVHKSSHNTERTMPCPVCGKLFPDKRKLQMHQKRHSDDKPYICEYCNKSFKLNMVLKRHLMIHTGEKPHACKVCGKRFADSSTVVRHMLTHTGETPFVCEKCPYKCNLEDIAMQENEKSSINGDGEDRNKYLDELQCKDEITVITDNIKVYENDLSEYSTNLQCENTNSINMYCNNYLLEEKTLNLDVKLDNEIVIKNEEQNNSNLYSEDSCINNADKTVSNITNIKDQLKLGRSPSDKLNHKELLIAECKQTEDSAEETNIVKCKNCNQSFHSKYLLNRHRVIHENKRYICQICNAEFHTFNQLKYHKQKHKNKFKLHQCDICKKVFKSRSNLTAHVKQHTRTQESKPVCELCGKIYADINSIRRHYETHNTDKTIPCPTCGKLFTNQKNMALHLVRHNPHNPHVCEHCSKGFKTLGGKKRHILIHTGEKPHPCKICDKRFADRSTLSRHMLTHTAETRFACDKCPYQCRYKQQFDKHLRKHK
ncbi:zinc finger protein [Holotrichia oblita]|uniref:Zinc finger protein n=1 Tax=Holotrichia oblita TaxID=644536 RepID=A0ACB9T505_HOLOL|nr:zinc finger protein [Holotrichia oblita]